MAQLRSVTCHMASHSVTCYPTQVNTPRLNPSHRPVLDLPTPEGWNAELTSRPGVEPATFHHESNAQPVQSPRQPLKADCLCVNSWSFSVLISTVKIEVLSKAHL